MPGYSLLVPLQQHEQIASHTLCVCAEGKSCCCCRGERRVTMKSQEASCSSLWEEFWTLTIRQTRVSFFIGAFLRFFALLKAFGVTEKKRLANSAYLKCGGPAFCGRLQASSAHSRPCVIGYTCAFDDPAHFPSD
eukprot:2960328-Pleurochrysis_carterae.AAC.1